MKKLVIFGDSFTDSHGEYFFKGEDAIWEDNLDDSKYRKSTWTYKLAQQLNLRCFNYSVPGSSIEFSLVKFFEYQNSGHYDPEDIIIVALSTPTRLWATFNIKNVPYTANWVTHPPANHDCKWFNRNLSHIKWLVTNTPDELTGLKIPVVVSFLQSWANNFHKGKLVLLPCFGLYSSSLPHGAVDDIVSKASCQTERTVFLNSNLCDVGFFEFERPEYCFDGKGFKEFRSNHLSLPNHAVLTEIMYQVIETMDPTKYHIDKFVKNIYTTPIKHERDLEPYRKAGLFDKAWA